MGDDTDPNRAGTLRLGSFLPYQLSVAAEGVSRTFAQQYERRFGITIPEWRVMAVLGEGVPRTTQDVIARTKMDRVKVSRAAIRLVDKGLIRRVATLGDQRAHELRLSESGAAMYRDIVPLARRLQLDLLDVFDQGELALLTDMLRRIEARADELGDEIQTSERRDAPTHGADLSRSDGTGARGVPGNGPGLPREQGVGRRPSA